MSTNNEDIVATTFSLGAITAYLMEIEIILTVAVLASALTLNVYRIVKTWKGDKDADNK